LAERRIRRDSLERWRRQEATAGLFLLAQGHRKLDISRKLQAVRLVAKARRGPWACRRPAVSSKMRMCIRTFVSDGDCVSTSYFQQRTVEARRNAPLPAGASAHPEADFFPGDQIKVNRLASRSTAAGEWHPVGFLIALVRWYRASLFVAREREIEPDITRIECTRES